MSEIEHDHAAELLRLAGIDQACWEYAQKAMRSAAAKLTTLLQRAETAERERDNWTETARQHLRNEEYYRGLLVQIGATLGPAAYTQDDGGIVDAPLIAKVPEVVEALARERDSAISDAKESAANTEHALHQMDEMRRERDEAHRSAVGASGWRPMPKEPKKGGRSQAPYDGKPVLVDFGEMGVRAVAWTEPADCDWHIWCVDDNKHGPFALRGYSNTGPRAPRRWMPMPAAPQAETAGKVCA
jgi:hypothetical protein